MPNPTDRSPVDLVPPPPTEHPPFDDPLPMRRSFVTVLVVVWALCVAGGAACGLTFAVYFPDAVRATAQIGAFLGAVLGLPLGLALGVIVRGPRQPRSIGALGLAMEVLGMVLALAVTSPWLIWIALAGARLLDPPARRVIQLGPLGRGAVALLATAVIGRAMGYLLARFFYRAYRLPDRPRWSLLPR